MELEQPPGGFILDDDALEPPPGGFILKDGPNDQARSLGQALLDALQQTMVQKPQEQMQFIKGLGQGAVRIPAGPEASEAEKGGTKIGRVALPVAGALTAGAMTGGVGLIPAALAVGGGAAAGNTASQVGALVAGGEAPESVGAALQESGKVGLEAALADLGVGGGIKFAKWAGPAVLQTLARIPSESLKRMIKNPDAIKLGTKAKAYTELQAAKSLRDAQRAVEAERMVLGKSVDDALTGFHQTTNGAKVVDVSGVATALDDVLKSAEAGSDVVAAALPKGELNRLRNVADLIRKNPLRTAKESVALRRAIDDLTAFKGGGVQAVSSDVGQRGARAMGSALRDSIGKAADDAGYAALSQANQSFSQFAGQYDEIGKVIGTKGQSVPELLAKIRSIGGKFNQGGLDARVFEKLAEKYPQVGKMLDALAARELTRLPAGTPSGVAKDLMRLALAPQFVGASIKGGKVAAPAIRAGARAGGSIAGQP